MTSLILGLLLSLPMQAPICTPECHARCLAAGGCPGAAGCPNRTWSYGDAQAVKDAQGRVFYRMTDSRGFSHVNWDWYTLWAEVMEANRPKVAAPRPMTVQQGCPNGVCNLKNVRRNR